MTIRQLAQETSVSASSVQKIVKKDLCAKKLAPKFVMTALTVDQRKTRLDVSRSNAQLIDSDKTILERLIAVDESWIYTYDPRMKHADMEWTFTQEPCPRKALQSRSQKKVMLILYFNSRGVILADFVRDTTVNTEVYIASLRRMCEAVRRKRPDLWTQKSFILLQDNAKPHTSIDTTAFFQKVNQELWAHPPYSPDLSPCDFFLHFHSSKRTSEAIISKIWMTWNKQRDESCILGQLRNSAIVSKSCRSATFTALQQKDITLKDKANVD